MSHTAQVYHNAAETPAQKNVMSCSVILVICQIRFPLVKQKGCDIWLSFCRLKKTTFDIPLVTFKRLYSNEPLNRKYLWVLRTICPSDLWSTSSVEPTITTVNIHPMISVSQLFGVLSVLTGRKRQWFKVDEAIRVLQSHKPVHAEYLRRLTNSRSPTCPSVCSTTNGNMQSSEVVDNSTPCYVFCSSQSSDVVNR